MNKEHLQTAKIETIEPIIEKIWETVKLHLKNTNFKLILYGSWAKENAFINSDIDIAIDTGEALEQRLLTAIKQDLENLPTLRKIDFVDLNNISGSLKEEILHYGKEEV